MLREYDKIIKKKPKKLKKLKVDLQIINELITAYGD